MKHPTLTPDEAAQQALADASVLALNNNQSALAEMMTALGCPVTRQMIQRWLHPDPEQRMQPRLGHGLMLLWAAAILALPAEEQAALRNGVAITVSLRPTRARK